MYLRKTQNASVERKAVKTLGERIIFCRISARFQLGNSVSQAELGKLVATLLGRTRPVSGATVSRWESGEFEPDLESLTTIAGIGGVSPGWLAFGYGGGAEPPELRTRDGVDRAFSEIESEKRSQSFGDAFERLLAQRRSAKRRAGKSEGRSTPARPVKGRVKRGKP